MTVAELKPESKKKEWPAENTVLVGLQDMDGKEVVIILDTPPFINIIEDAKANFVNVQTQIEIEHPDFKVGKRLLGFYYDITNDPTPDRACGLVSLGYYSYRVKLTYCEIISTNPFVVQSEMFATKPISVFGEKTIPAGEQLLDVRQTNPLRRVTQ